MVGAKHGTCDPHGSGVAVAPHVRAPLAREHVKVALALELKERSLAHHDARPRAAARPLRPVGQRQGPRVSQLIAECLHATHEGLPVVLPP
eukprot:scaffold21986_cov30-Tisochrysis_lutea.AAC.7